MDQKVSQKIKKEDLKKISDVVYEIPSTYRSDMRVPARVFANENILEDVLTDRSLWQLVNVATLPGIIEAAYAMPDIHEGYGFPIGGVAALDIDRGGVISPGGIGYDINCGVRLLRSDIDADSIKKRLEDLATALYEAVPSGVGQGGSRTLSFSDLDRVLQAGAAEIVDAGWGFPEDLQMCEEFGKMDGADPLLVSKEAKLRGADQIGTLGSGNHFLEVQKVTEIYDNEAADVMGLALNNLTIMIHCGSRGLGHQVCTDYVRMFIPKVKEWGFELPDRELVCAPFNSAEGQRYFAAMQAAANFAWANRQMITHEVRRAWKSILGKKEELHLVYDLSHNMGKKERHEINGQGFDLIVHRKGATRSFGPGHLDVVENYRSIGQPVLIPGTMGTASYVLAGNASGAQVAFGSSCHGAGRKMSRIRAKQSVRGNALRKDLEARGIVIRCDSSQGLAEEAPLAYKDIDDVVATIDRAGLARKVARLEPMAVIKGG